MENKTKWLIFTIVFLIPVSFLLIKLNVSPDINLNPNEYQFFIRSDVKEGNLHDLFLEYDFERKQGVFSFRIYGRNTTELRIDFPKEIKINSYSIKNLGENKEIFCDLINNSSGIICPNPPTEERINVTIRISEKTKENPFYPNGIFYFYSPLSETHLRYFIESHSSDLLNFNFGGEYRCSEKCFTEEMGNFNLAYNTNKDYFRIYSLPGTDDKLGTFSRFVINTYNSKKEINSGIGLAIGISLLSGLILTLFEMFSGINFNPIKKDMIHLYNKMVLLIKRVF